MTSSYSSTRVPKKHRHYSTAVLIHCPEFVPHRVSNPIVLVLFIIVLIVPGILKNHGILILYNSTNSILCSTLSKFKSLLVPGKHRRLPSTRTHTAVSVPFHCRNVVPQKNNALIVSLDNVNHRYYYE